MIQICATYHRGTNDIFIPARLNRPLLPAELILVLMDWTERNICIVNTLLYCCTMKNQRKKKTFVHKLFG